MTTLPVTVPGPSSAGDDATPPSIAPAYAPAEGDVALTLALVHRAQAGDADAFGELYDLYVGLVYRYIYYRVGHYKSSRYRLEMTTDDVSETGARLTTDGPEDAVLDGMQNTVLLEAVKQLGAEQQECIVLRFLQGMSVAETAQAMGKNAGAIKALQYRAVRALGRLLPEGVEL